MRPRAALLATLLAVCSSGMAETMYVTDKLILGVYGTSDDSGEQLRIVRSGAKLEVLERLGRYAKIRTEDGDEGWVKSQYLVGDPPAVLLVDEMEAKLEALTSNENDPAALQARALELESRVAEQTEQLQVARQESKTLQQELDLARDALAVAKAQTAAAEQRAAKAEQQAAKRAAPPPPPKPTPVVATVTKPVDTTGERINFYTQLALAGVGLVLLGMFLGYKALDLYIRRQHGGFRVW